jgi:hypothetical protein
MRDCPVTAWFTPQARTVEISGVGEHQGRAWRTTDIHSDGFSVLDCYLIPPSQIFGNMSHIDILLTWANQEDLAQEGIFAVRAPYPHSRMLSRKTIEGREVSYEHRLFLFREAFVLTATSGDSANFPSARNRTFTESISVLHQYD